MDYQKITFTIEPDTQDFRDVLMQAFGEAGFESFTEDETFIDGYIPEALWDSELPNALTFEPLFRFTWSAKHIPDQNWNEEWEKNYFQPLIVANRCVVRAPFHTNYPDAEIELVIEPKMAFGTGNHETTTLMMEYILEMNLQAQKVLDMGCGTGILAMLASKRGAGEIVAIDIDKWSYESTTENSALNGCNNIRPYLGDASLLGNEMFDIIFANIHKNILLQDVEQYSAIQKESGILLMSGFYEHDLGDITKAAECVGYEYLSHKINNKWVAAKYRKLTSK